MEAKDSLLFRRELLQEMISKTLFAVSTDQTRYSLSGVLLQVQDDIRMVATDGHRLAIVKKPRKEVQGTVRREAIIPKKALVEIVRLLKEDEDPVRIDFADSHLIINFRRSTLTSRLIEEQFPNYAAVIPEPSGKKVVLTREQLWGALRRTSTIVGERGAPTRIELTGNRMVVSCSNMDLGEATEFLEVDYSGEDIAIGFNGRYLLDFLSAVDEEQVVIYLSDSLSPTLFQPLGSDWYQCVIMPMRI
jgi:DNA polymerase-3 subunit beta